MEGDTQVVDAELVDPSEQITLECDICHDTVTGNASGPGSARFLLGSHKYRVHDVRGSKAKKNRSTSATTDADHEAHPITSTLKDMANDLANDGKGAPSAPALTKAFGRGLGMATLAAASYFVETDETIPFGPEGEQYRDALVTDLALSQKGAEEVMAPIGRLLAPTKLNKRYGRTVVENVDAVGAFAELVTIGLRWRRAFRERDFRRLQMADVAPINAVPVAGTAPPGAPAHTPPAEAQPMPPVVAAGGQSPPPVSGTIIGPEQVADMRRRRNG